MSENNPKHTSRKFNLILIGVGLGVFVWTLDSIVGTTVFNEGALIQKILDPEWARIYFRLTVSSIIILFSIYAQIVITKSKRGKETLRETHKELVKTKKHLEGLIDGSTDSVIATDPDGNVVLFNAGAEIMLGYRCEEIIGRHVTTLYNSAESAKGVMQQMRQGGGKVSALETLLRTKDDNLIPVLLSAFILYDEEGNEAGSVGFSKDLRERKELELRLEELAITDTATNLYNRAYLVTKLEEEFQRALRYNIPFSLMILDVDYFKSVNDTFGHHAGDTYLKAIAELVVSSVRGIDTVARYGGEEMVVILPHTNPDGALAVAERLREKVAALEVYFEGHIIRRTVSIGVTSYPEVMAQEADDLIKMADSALYAAKQGGRNRVILSNEGMKSTPAKCTVSSFGSKETTIEKLSEEETPF